MRVLVTDDDAGVRSLLQRVLTKELDVEVMEAEDGIAALGCLLASRIDLLLIDLAMPMMGGLETLESIRASREYADLPVVVLTGQAAEPDFARAQQLGISGFLVKPFSVSDFRDRISITIQSLRDEQPHGGHRLVAFEPSDRILVVDQSSEFLAIAERVLGRLARIETVSNEFAAIKTCLDAAPDVLVIGAPSDLSSTEGLARKLRSLIRFGRPRILAAAASADGTALEASGLFDAIVLRSFAVDAFERGLSAALSDDTRVRLLLHPSSAWLAEAFEISCRRVAEAIDAPVTLHAQRPALESAVRWVSADAEIQGTRFGCTIRVRCPLDVAIEMGGRQVHRAADEVSDATALAAMTATVSALASDWCAHAAAHGIACQSNHPASRVQPCLGAGPDAEVPLHARRWVMSGSRAVAIIESIPLGVRHLHLGTF